MLSINHNVRTANDLTGGGSIDTTTGSAAKDLLAGSMTPLQIRSQLDQFLTENMDELVSTLAAKFEAKTGQSASKENVQAAKSEAWRTAQEELPGLVNDLKSQWNEKTSGLRDIANSINTILNVGDSVVNRM